jgi:hypothetical protein
MAILKLDIGIYNLGIKVSKYILVNLVEPSPCGNNSLGSNSPVDDLLKLHWLPLPPLSILEVLFN